VNYLWFAERYRQFIYVDRVVVAPTQQGKRLGQLLYDDLFRFARENRIAAVIREFDIDPPNEPSRRFHSRYGFREVGTQWVADGKKQVSLQVAEVQAKSGAVHIPVADPQWLPPPVVPNYPRALPVGFYLRVTT